MQGEERCGKTAATCVKTVKTFGKIAATSARTAMSYGVIDEISGRMFNQERDQDRLRKTGGTCAKTGRIFGKIIGISDTIAKTGVETGKAYGTTWQAAKATAVKYLWAREAGNNFCCCRLFLWRNRHIQVFRLRTLPPKTLQPIYLSPARPVTSALHRARSHLPRWRQEEGS
jgi:hypothetical protein